MCIEELKKEIEKLCGNCDRPDKEELGKIILSSMTVGFNEGLKASSANRPQGYWTKTDVATYRCSECGKIQTADDVNELNFCCCCGSRNKMRRLKGADDE